MEVKFLGVRGSTATPGNEFSKFGGNTSCTEVLHKDFQVILDAGTGFKDIKIRKDVPVLILFSHFHFDHIQGLPFCRDLLSPDTPIYFSSALVSKDELKGILGGCFSPHYFPIELVENLTHIQYLEFEDAAKIIKFNCEITSINLRHPGGATGYKFETNTGRFCYLLDHEYDDDSAPEIIEASLNSNFIMWDGMFTSEELSMRKGWGHSSITQGNEFLEITNSKKMGISHHSPYRNDKDMMILEGEIKNLKNRRPKAKPSNSSLLSSQSPLEILGLCCIGYLMLIVISSF